MNNYNKPSVRLMLGFDCDRPRGSFIASEEGAEIAKRKLSAIQGISNSLESLAIPRTYFICGSFLESMVNKFGKKP